MNSKWLFVFIFNLIYYTRLQTQAKDSFTTVSSSLLNIEKCIPYAYGNFNADKFMDIFCVTNSGRSIEIWLAEDKEQIFHQYKVLNITDGHIVNLIPGDFNGDSIIDVLVLYKYDTNDNYLKMRLFTGYKSSKHDNDITNDRVFDYPYELNDEPLAVDLNGNGITDLFAEDRSDGKSYFYFDEKAGITRVKQKNSDKNPRPLYIGYCSSVFDTNNDYAPDLLITTRGDDDIPEYEVWTKYKGDFTRTNSYAAPKDAVVYGQSVVADFDSDGYFEHLLPVCKDSKCKKSSIFVYKNNEWHELPIDFTGFSFFEMHEFHKSMPISIKYGDYNLDGYVDLLVLMKDYNSIDKNSVAILLQNIPCTADQCKTFTRSFKIDLNANKLQTTTNVVVASFFDLFDDGTLDILLLEKDSKVKSDESTNAYKLVAFKNEMYDDVFFLKVMVIPGRCGYTTSCPQGILPYGMNYATPFTKITIQSFEYKTLTQYAGQLSQSTHFSLQLPFTIFGLGSTANFVDTLTVGIESNIGNNQTMASHREWTSIIPNSQLIVSTSPRNYPYIWKMQLFMTPSKNIMLTGITLGSTMVLLIFGIILLQIREKKIDEKERKLESQRFHFDGL